MNNHETAMLIAFGIAVAGIVAFILELMQDEDEDDD